MDINTSPYPPVLAVHLRELFYARLFLRPEGFGLTSSVVLNDIGTDIQFKFDLTVN